MNQATHAEPRPVPRERKAHVPQVDITHSAAAGQLFIAVHVDMEDGNMQRPVPPAGLKAAIAQAVQGVIDDLMPFPSAASEAPATEEVEA